MEDFEFQCPTKIIFGRGVENRVGEEVVKYSRRILFHYGGGSIKRIGLYDKVVRSLKEAGVEFIELPGVRPNPRLSLVKKGIETCRDEKIDFILAVGGGSVIDSAKAIAVGVPYNGDVWDFYTYKAEPKEALPVGVVLTIPGAGSEASPSSVITNEEDWRKLSITTELIRPKFAIMNPEVTFTVPPYQTACGVADIMAHVMERYFTNVRHVDLTDRLCEATLKTLIKNAPIAVREPENYDARAEIMWASTIAHNDILGTGRIGDWATHIMEHELSGLYDVPHGAGLAVLFPNWMRYVYKHRIDIFIQFAVRVWNVEPDLENPERVALEGIERLRAFFKQIGLPTTLKELGIPDDRLGEMALRCTDNGRSRIGNFVKLGKDDVLNIFISARE
ncbi:MAG: iron-containing alcohol dehydrogenase [Thermoproteota archaeon]|nr:iron-containing alcohol dehydrogenase [Candidatus Brockarchaeota archaeon]